MSNKHRFYVQANSEPKNMVLNGVDNPQNTRKVTRTSVRMGHKTSTPSRGQGHLLSRSISEHGLPSQTSVMGTHRGTLLK